MGGGGKFGMTEPLFQGWFKYFEIFGPGRTFFRGFIFNMTEPLSTAYRGSG